VVATPISANHEVLNSADVGFGAANELEWYDALKLLGSDAELRESMGSAGRKLVETDYSIEAVAPIYAALFARFVLESPAWNPSRVSNKS
jgi:glycosyltransferase involved in cell wall biosynthesis